jgi:hypothetical protein
LALYSAFCFVSGHDLSRADEVDYFNNPEPTLVGDTVPPAEAGSGTLR